MDGSDLPIPLEESMVLVLGETGAGKSFFVRKLTLNTDVRVGHYLESCSYFKKMKTGSHVLT
jgi:ABC-type phosphate/phosphonate transport system ATPase subunit